MVDSKNTTKPIKSVSKAFKILNAMGNQNWIGVSELSRLLGWHKSTVFGILNTLEQDGYVFKNEETLKYHLSLKLFALSSKALHGLDVYQIVHPFLLDITKRTEETTHFVFPDKYDVIYVDKVESSKSIRMCSQIGKRMPYYCTGVGKAILAFQSEEKIKEILSYTRLISRTKNTITDYNALIDELADIRKKGFATDNEEVEEGLYCVAVPLLAANGKAIAAISIAGPTVRMTPDRIPMLIDELFKCCREMSHFTEQLSVLR